MKLLAIETTDRRGTVAAMEDGRFLLEKELEPEDQRSAQSLVPTIDRLLKELNWSLSDLNLIAAAAGPGSFTGLRVGLTTAKVLAYALNIRMVGVDTLEAMAAGLVESVPGRTVSVAVDAQRGEVAARRFRITSDGPEPLDERFRIIPVSQWLGLNTSSKSSEVVPSLNSHLTDSKNRDCVKNTEESNVIHSGVIYEKDNNKKPENSGSADLFCSPVLKYQEAKVPGELLKRFVAESCRYPRARYVAEVAWRKDATSDRDEKWTLLPVYSRKSAAEEKADAAGKFD